MFSIYTRGQLWSPLVPWTMLVTIVVTISPLGDVNNHDWLCPLIKYSTCISHKCSIFETVFPEWLMFIEPSEKQLIILQGGFAIGLKNVLMLSAKIVCSNSPREQYPTRTFCTTCCSNQIFMITLGNMIYQTWRINIGYKYKICFPFIPGDNCGHH